MLSPDRAFRFGISWPHRGETHTLVGLSLESLPRMVTLRNDRTGELVETELLGAIHEHSAWATPEREAHDDVASLLALLDPRKLATTIERAGHIREVLTGNRTGEPYEPATCDKRYDPARFDEATRMQVKVADLKGVRGYSRSTLFELRTAYIESGGNIAALAPGGIPVPADPREGIDPGVIETIAIVVAELNTERYSSMDIGSKLVLLQTSLRERGVIDHPLLRARRLKALLKFFQRGIPQENTETRRNKASRTIGHVSAPKSSQFLERVEVDATRLNTEVYDPDTKESFFPYVLVAICCATKLMATRLCAKRPTTRDVRLLLFDMLRPIVLPDRHRDHLLMLGLPQELRIRQAGGELQTVVIDNGREMMNISTLDVALRLDIRIEGCRAGTGSDKPFVESANKNLDRVQQWFKGYVGNRPHRRGKKVTAAMSYAAAELILQEYTHSLYPHLPHTGLPVDAESTDLLTPAQAFERCLVRGGVAETRVHPDDVFALLDNDVVAVHSDGIRHAGAKYRGKALRYVVREDDSTSKYASSIRIFYDPADRSRVYFYSTERKHWCELHAMHDDEQALPPCSDVLWSDWLFELNRKKFTEDEKLDVRVAFKEFIERIIRDEPLRYAHDRAFLHSAVPSPEGTPGAVYKHTEDDQHHNDFPIDVDDYMPDDYELALLLSKGDDW